MRFREGGSLLSNVIESKSHRVEITTITARSLLASMHLLAFSIVTHCRPTRNGTATAKHENHMPQKKTPLKIQY
jgi:hypothetical protein